MRGLRAALGWTLVCALGACAGTETGNPSFVGTLGYDAYSGAPSVVGLSMALSAAEDAPLVVDSAWLVLGDVQLRAGADCAAARVEIDGLGAGDHASGQAPPTEFASEPGRFCGVELPFAPPAGGLPEDAPGSLQSESVLVLGQLPDGRAFEVHSALNERLSLRATAGDFVLDSKHRSVVIGFDVARWLAELSWDTAVTTDGSVIVSASSNPELLDQFEAAVPGGVTLFRDHDSDGELDSDPEPLAVGY